MKKFVLSLALAAIAPIAHNWTTEQLGFWGGFVVTSLTLVVAGVTLVTSTPFVEHVGPLIRTPRGRLAVYVIGTLVGAAAGLGLAHLALLHDQRQVARKPEALKDALPAPTAQSQGVNSPNIVVGHNSSVVANINTPAPPPETKSLLRLGAGLEMDSEARTFRLPVWNDGTSLAVADAWLVWLQGGQQNHDSLMPLTLRWMYGRNHVPATRTPAKVEVVFVDKEIDRLIFGSPAAFRHLHIHSSDSGKVIPVEFCIHVTFLDSEQHGEAAFRLVPDTTSALLYRAERLSVTCKPQRG